MKKIFTILALSTILISCKNTKKAELIFSSALKEYQNANFEKATTLCDESLKENSKYSDSYYIKGKSLFFQKKFNESIECFKTFNKLKGDNMDGQLWLIRAYIFSEKNDLAKELILQSLKTNSEDWRLYFWKAQTEKFSGDFKSYFSSLQTAEKLLQDASTVYKELFEIWNELGFNEKSSNYKNKMEILKNEN